MREEEIIRKDFNRIAQLGEKKWDHNRYYHRYLAKHVPVPCEKAMDIGCGIGEFTRFLAGRSKEVTGYDLSPVMLEKAKERSEGCRNIMYRLQDVMEVSFAENQYDCIASIATAHHLPLEQFLAKARDGLRPGGTLVILDLYETKTWGDVLLSCVATPLNILIMLLKTGHLKVTEEERRAWEEHGKHDTYMTIREIREICETMLPGVKVRRHLFWRYSLVWRK
jgi:2-polyprenyl-3-methyl-5-hydroxy-6-metoxy-1,4-benzoquinol methylase